MCHYLCLISLIKKINLQGQRGSAHTVELSTRIRCDLGLNLEFPCWYAILKFYCKSLATDYSITGDRARVLTVFILLDRAR